MDAFNCLRSHLQRAGAELQPSESPLGQPKKGISFLVAEVQKQAIAARGNKR